jgi:hypothetical protein
VTRPYNPFGYHVPHLTWRQLALREEI